MAQTWVKSGNLRPAYPKGTAPTGALALGVSKTITVPLAPAATLPYNPVVTVQGGDLLGQVTVLGVGTMTATSCQVTIKNSGLLALTGGNVQVTAL